MSNRKENIKKFLGVRRFLWSSDDDDSDSQTESSGFHRPNTDPNLHAEIANANNEDLGVANSPCTLSQRAATKLERAQFFKMLNSPVRAPPRGSVLECYYDRPSEIYDECSPRNCKEVDLRKILSIQKVKRSMSSRNDVEPQEMDTSMNAENDTDNVETENVDEDNVLGSQMKQERREAREVWEGEGEGEGEAEGEPEVEAEVEEEIDVGDEERPQPPPSANNETQAAPVNVAELLHYPCRHGCGRGPRLRRREAHEANCAARRYACFAPDCADRPLLPLKDLYTHMRYKHTTMMKIGKRQRFSVKTNTETHELWLVCADGELFQLRVDVDTRGCGLLVHVTYVTVEGRHERKIVYCRETHSDLENMTLAISRQDCFYLGLKQAHNFIRVENHNHVEKYVDFCVEVICPNTSENEESSTS
ncbi:hypothetical protein RR46_11128 [Papilio xuthus]|uniref:Uncharacterized protein n=1 Tax=Papilio xuthus TaxID=66420 RepID=A0A194PXF5_PAPXU|nr:hypothetical protein RR46_11128 [Papilio xuthus]